MLKCLINQFHILTYSTEKKTSIAHKLTDNLQEQNHNNLIKTQIFDIQPDIHCGLFPMIYKKLKNTFMKTVHLSQDIKLP